MGGGEAGGLERLAEAVGPADIGHQVARGAALDEVAELEPRVVVLAGGDRDVDAARDPGAGGEIVGQAGLLVPDELEVLELRRLLEIAEHIDLLVHVHHQPHAATRGSGWWIFIL